MGRGNQGGKSGGKAQMAQPPVTKYRKNIGTYQRDTSHKVAKRDYRDKADARKGFCQISGLSHENKKNIFGIFFRSS